MSDKRYYSVQVTKRMEVCVKAKDEAEAEEIAGEADFDWVMADVEDATAEEMYNGEDGSDDAHLVEEFKRDDRYAE